MSNQNNLPMKKSLSVVFVAIGLLLNAGATFSQATDGLRKYVDDLNRSIDHAVVKKDFETLQK